VHAAAFHWGEIGRTARRARAENQCARVYSALGRPEAALHHALRALELAREGGDGFEDWDLATALEVVARAHLAAGNRTEAKHYAELAESELDKVAEPEDREIIGSQLAELKL
jgi:tetratricopeptide (TPR) repeat protein